MIYLASDHTGYKMKEGIKEYLLSRGYKIKDLGADNTDPVHYSEMARQVAEEVVKEFNSRGILVSDTGIGMSIAANKVKKISAALVHNVEVSEITRLNDNSNILCLPSNYVTLEHAKEIIGTWLSTSFSSVNYYVECIKQIREMENE